MPQPHASSFRIRPAQIEDSREIARLAGELGYPAADHDIATRLASLLPLPNHHVVVAEGSDELLGWVAVERRQLLVAGDKAELMGLVVGSSARHMGVGRALVAAAENWAAVQGLDVITVRSNAVRAESHPFYERIGYTRRKSQHVYTKALPRAR